MVQPLAIISAAFRSTGFDKGFNLLADLHGEQKSSFGFCDLDEPVIHGVAVVLGGSPRRLRTLHENKASFDMIVDWR